MRRGGVALADAHTLNQAPVIEIVVPPQGGGEMRTLVHMRQTVTPEYRRDRVMRGCFQDGRSSNVSSSKNPQLIWQTLDVGHAVDCLPKVGCSCTLFL